MRFVPLFSTTALVVSSAATIAEEIDCPNISASASKRDSPMLFREPPWHKVNKMRIILSLILFLSTSFPVGADLFSSITQGLSPDIMDKMNNIIRETEENKDRLIEIVPAPLDELNRVGSPKEICAKYPNYPGCLGVGTPDDPLINGIRP